MENVSNLRSNNLFIDCVMRFEDPQDIIEEMMTNEQVIDEAVMLLDGLVCVGRHSSSKEWHLQTCPLSRLKIDPDVEIPMDHSSRDKILIDLEQRILGVRLQKNTPFARSCGPAFHNGGEDLANDERSGFNGQPRNHLHKQGTSVRVL